jgi:uncharacterized protein YbbK (DUF523 family)
MKILVSACLLGVPCRYDAKSKPDERVIALSKKHELIPVCAEVLGGLETPRIPAEIVGDKVLRRDGVDVTREYHSGAQCVLDIAIQNSCKIAILKSKSPSCGKGKIYDGTYTKTLKDGNGICADLLIKNNITVLTEREIDKI